MSLQTSSQAGFGARRSAGFDAPLAACPQCGSASIRPFDRDAKQLTISRCSDCRLLFLDPRYSDEQLDELYANYRSPESLTRGFDPGRLQRKRRELAAFAAVAPQGACLCIGCGNGMEMVVASEVGFSVEGIDIDSESAQRVGELYGFKTYGGDLLTTQFESAPYQAVVFDQVLEHLKEPRRYLERVFELLTPGGVAYVGVPNIGSVSARFKTLTGKLGLKPKARRGRHYDTWHHINYFTPRSLTFGLEATGFELVQLSGCPPAGDGDWLDRLRTRFPLFESSMCAYARKPL
ncbi:MAG: class I SAM-dependent methyltransferase [Planctomycetota bacterium]